MQNLSSPNRFYLTLPLYEFWSFNKMLNIKKIDIYTFLQIYDFSSFWADFNYLFLSTVNKCTITMIIIIIIMKIIIIIIIIIIITVKSLLERHFCGITIKCLKTNVILWQKAVLHTTTLMLCKAKQVLGGPAKWRVTVSEELRFMTPYLES